MNKLHVIEETEKGYLVEYTLGDETFEKEVTSQELMADFAVESTKVYTDIKIVTYAVEISKEEENLYDVYTNTWTYYKDDIDYNDKECKTYKKQSSAEKYAMKLYNELYKTTGHINHKYCVLTV